MRIRVVRAAATEFPDGGYVCVRNEAGTGTIVLLLNGGTFTKQDASVLYERLQRNPDLLVALDAVAA
jgi:hypothetical protein